MLRFSVSEKQSALLAGNSLFLFLMSQFFFQDGNYSEFTVLKKCYCEVKNAHSTMRGINKNLT